MSIIELCREPDGSYTPNLPNVANVLVSLGWLPDAPGPEHSYGGLYRADRIANLTNHMRVMGYDVRLIDPNPPQTAAADLFAAAREFVAAELARKPAVGRFVAADATLRVAVQQADAPEMPLVVDGHVIDTDDSRNFRVRRASFAPDGCPARVPAPPAEFPAEANGKGD